jgi:hypothetical protein
MRAALLLLMAIVGHAHAGIIPGYNVQKMAWVTDPMNLVFAGGALYVARDNVGSGGDFSDSVPIHKVLTTGVVSEYGFAIPDPDAIAYDALGTISGVSGTVLVGSGAGLYAIHPDQSVVQLFTSTQVGGEINDMSFDSTGRLVMLVGDSIRATAGGQPQLLKELNGWTPVSLAIGTNDEIVLGGLSGTIDIYSSGGVLLKKDFVTGLGWTPRIRRASGGSFGHDLYAMMNDGNLMQIGPDGSMSVFGTEFAAGTTMTAGSWIEFGSDGTLYVAEFPNDRLLAITPVPEPDSAALLAFGLLLTLAWAKGANGAKRPVGIGRRR